MICTMWSGGAAAPTARAEGRAELISDVVLSCRGGVPTPAGQPVPKVTLDLNLDTPVTSRLLSSQFSEALLIIDDWRAVNPGNVPLLVCGAPLSGERADGICDITADGSGLNTYNGSPGHPNVFQGKIIGPRQIRWTDVPLDAIGDSGALRTLRFTNLRADANTAYLGWRNPSVDARFGGAITAFGDAAPMFENYRQTLASVSSGMSSIFGPLAVLSRGTPSNAGLLNGSTQVPQTAQYAVTLQEGYPNAFLAKNIAHKAANAPRVGLLRFSYPSDQNQSLPGFSNPPTTETGFFNGVSEPVLYRTWPSPTDPFPDVRGLNRAGIASQGTRLYLRFGEIPSGVQLYTPVQIFLRPQSYSLASTGLAVLTSTDGNGAGPFTPVGGGAEAYAPLQAGNMAVYEILSSDASRIEQLTVPVAAAYVTRPGPCGAAITLEAGLAPIDPTAIASAAAPVPRFVGAVAHSGQAFQIQPCAASDLVPTIARSGVLRLGAEGAFTLSVTNSGDDTQGTVLLTSTLPPFLTPKALSGSGWTCDASALTCSRNDLLTAGESYPPVTLSFTATQSGAGAATTSVQGGGDTSPQNSTASSLVEIETVTTTFLAEPAGAVLSIDGTVYKTPAAFHWMPGTQHTLAVTSPQLLANRTRLMFQRWSDAGLTARTIHAGDISTAYTAVFTTEYELAATVNPPGTGAVTPSAAAFHAAGSVVAVEATAAQGYRFQSWTGPVTSPSSARTTVTIDAAKTLVATFVPLQSEQSIGFDPIASHTFGDPPFRVSAFATSGLPVTLSVISGPAYISNGVITLTGGGTVVVRATQTGNGQYRAASDVTQSFVVNWPRRSLSITAVPLDGGALSIEPAPVGGTYEHGTLVHVTPSPKPGWIFAGFSGDLSGSISPQWLTMDANRTAAAIFIPASGSREKALVFGMRRGGSLPASQSISLLENSGAVSVSATTTNGGPWIAATTSPAPRSVQISIVPDVVRTLPNGIYSGYVAITDGSSTRIVPVTLAVDVVHIAEVANSAAYTSGSISPGGLFTLFGSNIGAPTALASRSSATLDGVSVQLTDNSGVTADTRLLFVAPNQVNLITPDDLAIGPATLTLITADSRKTTIPVEVGSVSPGLFSADGTGKGVAAATVLRVATDGSRSVTLAAECSEGSCEALPIDVGSAAGSVYVALYGTGIRGCSHPDAVSATVGGTPVKVLYSGPQQQPGLDQINIALGRDLAGLGAARVDLIVCGQSANVVTLNIR